MRAWTLHNRDIGQGAMDDAGPAFVALQALVLMKRLNLQPKRTVRWVGWTTEERGSRGMKCSRISLTSRLHIAIAVLMGIMLSGRWWSVFRPVQR